MDGTKPPIEVRSWVESLLHHPPDRCGNDDGAETISRIPNDQSRIDNDTDSLLRFQEEESKFRKSFRGNHCSVLETIDQEEREALVNWLNSDDPIIMLINGHGRHLGYTTNLLIDIWRVLNEPGQNKPQETEEKKKFQAWCYSKNNRTPKVIIQHILTQLPESLEDGFFHSSKKDLDDIITKKIAEGNTFEEYWSTFVDCINKTNIQNVIIAIDGIDIVEFPEMSKALITLANEIRSRVTVKIIFTTNDPDVVENFTNFLNQKNNGLNHPNSQIV
ncbi:hypothetical protein F4810DRAFT_715923 [Camillea tinctor]|nr:hypothetical protein F4810DRAFT_715923 [Camillea tinctor]